MVTARIFTNSVGKDYCRVRYTPSMQMVTATWKGGATKESVRQVRDWLLLLLEEHPCPLLLNDMEDLMVVSSEDFVTYLREEWDVKAATLGLRYIADVVGKNTIAEKYLYHITAGTSAASSKLITKTFNSRFDALDWLLEKRGNLDN